MEWQFAKNNENSIKGYTDAGMETFKNSNIETALMREAVQNSLDALADGEKKVIVSFETHQINQDEIVGLGEYENIIKSIKNDPKNKGQNKLLDFCKTALCTLEKNKINCLKVSDYNTNGLRKDTDSANGTFNALAKSSGYSEKHNSHSGGSFGIGKSVFWLNSLLRQVFISTKNKEGEVLFQGISKLVTHMYKEQNYKEIGYLGDGFEMIEHIPNELTNILYREESGTDILVIGSSYGNVEEFKTALITSAILNFFYSIKNDKLEILINETKITRETINDIVTHLPLPTVKADEKKLNIFKEFIVANENKIVKYEGKGCILKMMKNEELTTAYIVGCRETGMLIHKFDRNMPHKPIFGILEITDEKLSESFRLSENLEHNKWSVGQIEDKQHKKDFKVHFQKIKTFILESIEDFMPSDESNSFIIEGLSDLFEKKIDEPVERDIKKIESKETFNKINETPTEFVLENDDEHNGINGDDETNKKNNEKQAEALQNEEGYGKKTKVSNEDVMLKILKSSSDGGYALRIPKLKIGNYKIDIVVENEEGKVVSKKIKLLEVNSISSTAAVIEIREGGFILNVLKPDEVGIKLLIKNKFNYAIGGCVYELEEK